MELNLESKRKLAQSVHEAFEAGDGDFRVVYQGQRKPYTHVYLEFDNTEQEIFLIGLGFSKVNYPDVFSSDGGYTIAINDALHHLIGKIFTLVVLENEELETEIPF